MKKLFLVVVAAVLICSTVSAQLVTTKTVSESESESKTIWILRSGLTVATLAGDGGKGSKSLSGYNAGIEFNHSFGESGVYWGSGLLFGNKGCKDFSVAKLDIPLNFGYKYRVADNIKIDGHAGGYVGYDLFGGIKDGPKIADINDYNRLTYGLQFGAGVWLGKWNLDISYQKGLSETIKDSEAYESNILFRVGYAF
jgi:hypothetical protein